MAQKRLNRRQFLGRAAAGVGAGLFAAGARPRSATAQSAARVLGANERIRIKRRRTHHSKNMAGARFHGNDSSGFSQHQGFRPLLQVTIDGQVNIVSRNRMFSIQDPDHAASDIHFHQLSAGFSPQIRFSRFFDSIPAHQVACVHTSSVAARLPSAGGQERGKK